MLHCGHTKIAGVLGAAHEMWQQYAVANQSGPGRCAGSWKSGQELLALFVVSVATVGAGDVNVL